MRLDLNADVGESFGAYAIGHDDQIMRAITSANVAAGFHGGDPGVLRKTIRLAKQHGVAVGAHPGFPDLAGFGRREMSLSPAEVEDLVLYQVAAVAGVAHAEGIELQHVKPHGALYNMAARDGALADAIARAAAAFRADLMLFGLPDSELLAAGRRRGLPVVAEAFADRAYQRDGTLVPRNQAGAVLHEVEPVVARAIRLAAEGRVQTIDGGDIAVDVRTLCVHGDTPGAASLARALREGLEGAGVRVAPAGAES
jgi:UPF0271 protein